MLGLSEDTYVKLGIDETFHAYIDVSSKDDYGAILGYNAIPVKYLANLELHDVLVSVADDLGGFSSEEQMQERYVNHKPYNVNQSLLI